MANSVLVFGRPGSGKSTSMETLDPKTTFIVNVAAKALPFRGWKKLYTPFNSKEKTGNMVSIAEAKHILAVMDIVDKELPHVKTLVLDDYQYMSAFEYMNRINETGYAKFNDIAKNIFSTVTKAKDMRDDLTIFYINHEDETGDDQGEVRIRAKTAGKLIENLLSLEGLFTVVLHSNTSRAKDKTEYFFETQTDSKTTAKSSKNMFETFKIPNDLELVRKSVVNYAE